MDYETTEDLFHDPDVGPKLLEMVDGSTWAKDFSEDDVKRLCRYLRLTRHERGSVVFAEGDPDDSMAIILEGSIEITKKDTSPEHKPKCLVRIGPGRAFGELALIEGPPRSATARALDGVSLLVLSRVNYERLCAKDLKLALKVTTNIARLMSFRLRNTSVKLVEYL
ncbi:Cyclic nucleotide-gated potassium channel [Fundidesulfovibrio magnetotacticus]|uniref:Cyclic nucleotide-gated potassium channel n=1 Tax=Fundidesulfovibrio magnetotacticus TaxID=2730080 RepID=A0A6V8LIC9_9BACT|nr:cyclic nucleotide-binding domain-containing protein [Fundidesulfovibrio magnetotacticus]GFK92473.1 Cyclic nucleotide-gated potassium channel [Fundidesulfovibrio magnetotacticus]